MRKGAMRRGEDTERLCAKNTRAQGCRALTSDQWWLIHGEERLIRDERAFGGNFQQASMESGKSMAVERRPIRNRKVAAMMMMRAAVMILTIIG